MTSRHGRLRRRLHHPDAQFELPGMVTFGGATRPEPERVYQSVLALRREGKSVYRAGTGMHAVDGFVVTSKQLIDKGGMGWL